MPRFLTRLLYARPYARACEAYNAATAIYRDAKRRGDTRDQHTAAEAVKARLNAMLRLERRVGGRA